MNYLGQPFPAAEHSAINAAIATTDAGAAVAELQKILDKYALAIVDINAESRVKVEPGPAKPELVEGGTRLFLVKVINRANVTAPLRVASPNSGPMYIQSNGSPEPKLELTPRNAADRWADISIYDQPPMDRRLSGLALDYRVLQIYSRDRGQRSAQISFNVGQGSQDIGFRNDILVLFDALPTRAIKLRVRDENGQPAMASLVIRDRLNRLYPNPAKRLPPTRSPSSPASVTTFSSALCLPSTSYVKGMPSRIPGLTGMLHWGNRSSKPLLGLSTKRRFRSQPKITKNLPTLQVLLRHRSPNSKNLLSLGSASTTLKPAVLSTQAPLGTLSHRTLPL